MSKLDNIILEYGNAVLDLPKTNDPIGKPVDEAKASFKALMIELIGEDETRQPQSIPNAWVESRNAHKAELRQKVEAL